MQRQAWMVALAVLVAVFLQEQILVPLQDFGDINRQVYHGNDLKHLYLASRLLGRGENPYPAAILETEAMKVGHPEMHRLNPYVYPPFTGYLFSWFGELDYNRAKTVWFWGSQALLLASLALFARGPNGVADLPWITALVASVAFFFPLFRSTTAGQLNHVLLFLLSLVFWFWRNGRKKAAGAVLGLATLVKVQPAFLIVWLAWKREWGALVSAILTIILLILVPGMYYGLNPYFDYIGTLKDMTYGSSTWSDRGAAFYVDPSNIGVPALLYRLFTTNPRTQPWIDLGSTAYVLCLIWAALVFGSCLLCCRIRRRDEDPEMEMSAWIFGMLLIPSLFWDHYLVLALPAWFTLISRLSRPGMEDVLMALAAAVWAWAGWKFYWFDSGYLSGLGMLHLNASLPAVFILFALCAWMAKISEPRGGGYG
jgi:hypothetical protein